MTENEKTNKTENEIPSQAVNEKHNKVPELAAAPTLKWELVSLSKDVLKDELEKEQK